MLIPNWTERLWDAEPQVFKVADGEETTVSHCEGLLFKLMASLEKSSMKYFNSATEREDNILNKTHVIRQNTLTTVKRMAYISSTEQNMIAIR